MTTTTPGPTGQVAPETAVVRQSVLPAAGSTETGPATPAAASLSCPECGTTAEVVLSRRAAEDFCRACDYPLFWARPEHAVLEEAPSGDDARRRLPGSLGTTRLATVPCPHCVELNLPGAELCLRCGSTMTPPPAPVPLPAPLPEPVPEPVVEEPPAAPVRFPWWWLASVGLLVGAVVVAARLL
ncbi:MULTISPECIES: hypothetical protein [Georgenia]|uniref:DZANK-type domain-containing protein n=1 Tax=Georgenia wutianyii TaxID=2585135 RepID=A0ABX5VP32_9MICO|nr:MULTISPECIES: hypothetical protein [Georgenia]QDB79133.1 hypothetical protein FE251_06930 [Georgenia wutianyii]